MTVEKGTPEVLALYEKMLCLGLVDRVVVTTSRDEKIEKILANGVSPGIEFYPNSDRLAYLRHASRTAASIFNSPVEASSVMLPEVALVGCVPVLPNKPWVVATFGKHGWPWVYDSMDEAARMLLAICDNHREAAEAAVRFVHEHYSARVLAGRLVQWADGIVRQNNRIASLDDAAFQKFCDGSGFVESVKRALVGEIVSWGDLTDKIQFPKDRMGRPVVITHHDLPALVSRLGYDDDYETMEPVFRRRA